MHGLQKFLLFNVLTLLIFAARVSGIIHGEKAPENSMLYMVSLQNNRGHHVCGGFLVSKDFVVTSAHCDLTDPARVVLGTHDLRRIDNEKIRYIEKRFKHPSYVSEGNGKDIMLLKLSHEIRPENSVQTIPIPSSDMNIRENEACRVAGWGSTATGQGPAVDELRVVNVSVINLQVCKKELPGLPDNVICAGGFGTKKGFCQGDSGGPLLCNGKVVGVVSFNSNYNCNYPNKPNVYTDISKFVTWIRANIGMTHYEEKSNFCFIKH